MAKYTLIQNARIVGSSREATRDADLVLELQENGQSAVITAIEPRITKDALTGTVQIINARGNLITPCFADLSTVIRDPGLMYKQNIASMTASAVKGGYDTLLGFFEASKPSDMSEALYYWHALPKNPKLSFAYTAEAFLPNGQLAPLEEYLSYHDVALTNRFCNSDNRAILLSAMRASREADRTFVLYPSVASLSRGGVVNRHIAPLLRLPGVSPVAEELAVAEGIMLSEDAGCRLHIGGISTKKSVALVREAKASGLPVTADTSPAYFYFNEGELYFRGMNAKLSPPLREESDRLAVIEGIRDATIDAIASHHTPHAVSDYQNVTLLTSPFGSLGLKTAFAAAVEALLSRGVITIPRLVELFCDAPRRILSELGFRPESARIAVGESPNFNLVALDKKLPVTKATYDDRTNNAIFLGTTLQGRVERSFRRGVEIRL